MLHINVQLIIWHMQLLLVLYHYNSDRFTCSRLVCLSGCILTCFTWFFYLVILLVLFIWSCHLSVGSVMSVGLLSCIAPYFCTMDFVFRHLLQICLLGIFNTDFTAYALDLYYIIVLFSFKLVNLFYEQLNYLYTR